MIFTQHYLACLSHASYLIGDETTGRAVVVDPRRDVDVYVEEAAARGLASSGSSRRTYMPTSSAVTSSWRPKPAPSSPTALVRRSSSPSRAADGQRLSLGEVTLEILATPGHTPESICVVVYEHAVTTTSRMACSPATRCSWVMSGVPIWWPRAASALSADAGAPAVPLAARQAPACCRTRPQVFPAHGAGSSCGRQLSSETSSTLGEQRLTNYALKPMTEDEFVAAVTEGQPARPRYFELRRPAQPRDAPAARGRGAPAARRRLGDRAPRPGGGAARRPRTRRLRRRAPAGCGQRRSPGPVRRVGRRGAVTRARRRARRRSDRGPRSQDAAGRVGYDRVVGQLDDLGGVFAARPRVMETSSRLTIEQLAELRGLETALQLVDVRGPGETAGGTLARGPGDPAGRARRLAGRARPGHPVVVYCASGYRSRWRRASCVEAGFADVSDLLGGYAAWEGAGCRPRAAARARPRRDATGRRAGRRSSGRRGRAAPRRPGTRRMGGGARA